MKVQNIIIAASLLIAAPVMAQVASRPATASNAGDWDIFQKLYPKRALAAHEEGNVGFLVTLDSRGTVMGCKVTRSSGHPLLDEETCKLVTLNAVFKPDPSIGDSQVRTHEGMISWRLPGRPAQLVQPLLVATGPMPEKVVCKKVPRTGSLASFDRTCVTVTEWAKQSDQAKEMWGDVQGKKGSTNGN